MVSVSHYSMIEKDIMKFWNQTTVTIHRNITKCRHCLNNTEQPEYEAHWMEPMLNILYSSWKAVLYPQGIIYTDFHES